MLTTQSDLDARLAALAAWDGRCETCGGDGGDGNACSGGDSHLPACGGCESLTCPACSGTGRRHDGTALPPGAEKCWECWPFTTDMSLRPKGEADPECPACDGRGYLVALDCAPEEAMSVVEACAKAAALLHADVKAPDLIDVVRWWAASCECHGAGQRVQPCRACKVPAYKRQQWRDSLAAECASLNIRFEEKTDE